jgi:hypothetical protein
MHLDLMRDPQTVFPEVRDPVSITSLRVWHCKYKSLRQICRLENLRELAIASYPDEDFEALKGLGRLEFLSVVHLPKITDLSPLSELRQLTTLSLATAPSWDTSARRTVVKTLEPLAGLPALRHLELFGVVPQDEDISCLQRCPNLRTARFSKYPAERLTAFYAESRISDAHAPRPQFESARAAQ